MARSGTETKAAELTPEEEGQRIAALIADREQARLAAEANAVKQERAERGQKLVRRVIDPHEGRLATVTSSWETLTPSMCLDADCNYDAAKERGWKNGYDSIPEDLVLPWNNKSARQDAEDLLAQHVAIAHSSAGPAHIRTPEQVRAIRAQRPVPETFVTNPRLT
jgi:hypothetical protein